MGRVEYRIAFDICEAIRIIIREAGLSYIDPERIHCVRSNGSRSRAIARIYGLPRAWIVALGWNPGYVIEVISEKFDKLSGGEKVKVLIHELLHIPRTFSGGLRPHGTHVNSREVSRIFRVLQDRGVINSILEVIRE